MEPYSGTPGDWDGLIAGLPGAHLLQTWDWSQVKARVGWIPSPFLWRDAGGHAVAAAMILRRVVPTSGFAARLCVLYVPKGPVMDWADASMRARVLDDLQDFSRRQGAIFIKLDPDVELGTGVPGETGASEDPTGAVLTAELKLRGWRFSADQVQFRNSVVIDLRSSEDDLLARMKQKTRYNVRLAEKKGVRVRIGSPADFPMLYKMYAETSVRDGFVIRGEDYYQTVWSTFSQPAAHPGAPAAEALIAEVEGRPVAGLFLFYFGGRAYYLYGMSGESHREKMPNYSLQWEAMRRAKSRGCLTYDLWGAPDVFDSNDPMQGVFRFKQGLGGAVVRTLGAWDYPARPIWYQVYTQLVPRMLDIMRLRGRARTQRRVEE